MTKQAWFCPSCQRHHAPHVETCPKPVDLIGYPLPTSPGYALPLPGPVFNPCNGCKGQPCGNSACPLLPRLTCAAGALPTSPNVSYTIGTGTPWQ